MDAAAEVAAADMARLDAMVAGDVAALERLMAPEFFYTHRNGLCEGREPYLDRLRGGKVRYRNPRRTDLVAGVYGDFAVLNGRIGLESELLREHRRVVMDNLFMSAWVRTAGRWLIVGYASTAIPPQ